MSSPGREEFGDPAPQYLYADAEKNEGREPQRNRGAGVAKDVADPVGEGEAEIDDERQHSIGKQRGEIELDAKRKWIARCMAGAERDHHRDCARTRGDGHGEWIESHARIILVWRGIGGLLFLDIFAFVLLKELPAGRRDHDPAGHAQGGHGNPEELEHIAADKQGNDKDKKTVNGNPARKRFAGAVCGMAGELEEDERAAGRIDDGKGGCEDEQEKASEPFCESRAHANRPALPVLLIRHANPNSHRDHERSILHGRWIEKRVHLRRTMRVTGGSLRGRALAAPADMRVRPTADRVREAIFNILSHNDFGIGFTLAGARVVDLFAGTGAMGIEAVSRGAKFCLFVDSAAESRALLRENVESLALTGITKIWRRDATALGPLTSNSGGPFNLAFLDPPYRKNLIARALVSLRDDGWLAPRTLIVAEHASDEKPAEIEGFSFFDSRHYSDTTVEFLNRK